MIKFYHGLTKDQQEKYEKLLSILHRAIYDKYSQFADDPEYTFKTRMMYWAKQFDKLHAEIQKHASDHQEKYFSTKSLVEKYHRNLNRWYR